MLGNGILVTEQATEASAGLNPPPLIVTPVPTGPELGLRMIEGEEVVTRKVAVAESPVLPVTLIVWTPCAALLETVKAAEVKPPLEEIVHEESVTTSGRGVLVIGTQEPASLGLNPLPVTVTVVPAGPELLLRAIVGV